MPGATTRLALPYPLAADSPAGHTQMQALANAIDNAVIFGQGLLSARPAAAIQGRIYFATDTAIFYYDTGSAWISINVIADGSVTNAKLAADAVTAAKIAADAVGSSEIAALAVGNAELAALSVDGPKIAASLKPSGGAAAGTEALRALGTTASTAAAGLHSAQHSPSGADPLDWAAGVKSVAIPRARVTRLTDKNISTGTDTILDFNSEVFDTNTIHDNVTNNSRLTCVTAGAYLIFAEVAWEGNATGLRHMWFALNGNAAARPQQDTFASGSGSQVVHSMATVFSLTPGDYVEVYARQTSGSTIASQVIASHAPIFGMTWLAP